jgi:hypothetical protein
MVSILSSKYWARAFGRSTAGTLSGKIEGADGESNLLAT